MTFLQVVWKCVMMVCGGQCAAVASGGDKMLKWCADNLVTLALVCA